MALKRPFCEAKLGNFVFNYSGTDNLFFKTPSCFLLLYTDVFISLVVAGTNKHCFRRFRKIAKNDY